MGNKFMGKMNKFLNTKEGQKIGGYEETITMSTGFKTFDYLNGDVSFLGGFEQDLIGIGAGKGIQVVGKPGSGKSTFAYQTATAIASKYENSGVFIMDYEGAFKPDRIISTTGVTEEWFRENVTVFNKGIYSESLLMLVKQIRNMKLEAKEELLVDNADGILDPKTGQVRKILPPTFIIVDSLAAMRVESFYEGDGSKLNGLTSGGRNAIANKEIMVQCGQPSLEANIVIIFVNHVNTNVAMGGTVASASTKYLGASKAVSGGNAVQYLVDLFIEIEAGELLEDDGGTKDIFGGVKGFKAKVKLIKSRNAEAGYTAPLVFNQREGFDRDLSTLEYLIGTGALIRSPYSIPDTKGYSFTRKNLKEKLKDPTFRAMFDEYADSIFKASLKVSSKTEASRRIEEAFAEEVSNMSAEDIAARDAEAAARLEAMESKLTKELESVQEVSGTMSEAIDKRIEAGEEI